MSIDNQPEPTRPIMYTYLSLLQSMESDIFDEHYLPMNGSEEPQTFLLQVHFSIYCFCVLNYDGQFSDMYKIVTLLKRQGYGVHIEETMKDKTIQTMYETLTEKYS